MQKLIGDASIQQLESELEKYLTEQGYRASRGVKIRGKSGIEHTFNLLARLDDGFASYSVAFVISTDSDRENQLATLFNFANKAYDTGIRDRVLIAGFDCCEEAREFAQKQGIRIIHADEIDKLTIQKTKRNNVSDSSSIVLNKADLLKALSDRGYLIEEKAAVKGRSGAEYVFDILAYADYGLSASSLGIDIFSNTDSDAAGLRQVSLFDTKAYDVGIEHKAILAIAPLSKEAKQFATLQGIRIIEALASPPPAPVPSKGTGAKPDDKPKTENKPLRQRIVPDAIQLIPEVMARRYNAIPISVSGNTLTLAMADTSDIFAIEAFTAQSHKRIRPVAVAGDEVREAIDFNYKATGEIEEQLSRVSISNEMSDDKLAVGAAVDAPLAQALNLILEEAAKARASDVHIEPEENRLRIRYRIDGTLHDTMSLPTNIHRALVSRIKILAQMNIADHFRPQDGQFSIETKGRQLDIRVATAPVIHGEMAVLRLLDKTTATREMGTLGISPESLVKYQKILGSPYGMILISGPTGAGKTTTLYASINAMDTISRNVITIEDPAEYRFKDINQIQVNVQAGITFASGLRSILRLDPNVIMVGEIRDGETAGIATQAALTGHLVLSSVHANDSTGAISRLLDLGIEPFIASSAILGVVAQRMVRRICPDCGRLTEVSVADQLAYEVVMGEKQAEFQRGTGCKTCAYTGYLGRTGLFEVLVVTDEMRTLIMKGAAKHEIRAVALKSGMVPMIKDGMMKAKAGITTITEVLQAAYTQE
jgi:general secretion pathway protein E